MDEVPALNSRRNTLCDKVNSSDFLKVDEKREATGYEPLEDDLGDVVLVAKKNRVLGEEDNTNEDGLAPGEKDDDKDDEGNPLKPNGKGNGKDAAADA